MLDCYSKLFPLQFFLGWTLFSSISWKCSRRFLELLLVQLSSNFLEICKVWGHLSYLSLLFSGFVWTSTALNAFTNLTPRCAWQWRPYLCCSQSFLLCVEHQAQSWSRLTALWFRKCSDQAVLTDMFWIHPHEAEQMGSVRRFIASRVFGTTWHRFLSLPGNKLHVRSVQKANKDHKGGGGQSCQNNRPEAMHLNAESSEDCALELWSLYAAVQLCDSGWKMCGLYTYYDKSSPALQECQASKVFPRQDLRWGKELRPASRQEAFRFGDTVSFLKHF